MNEATNSLDSVPNLHQTTRDELRNKLPRFELLLLLVSVAAALPFVPSLGGPFIWDDTGLIRDNPHVHSFFHIGHSLTHAFFDTGPETNTSFIQYFRPLLHLSYALDWTVGEGNPVIFHATNLVLAMLATCLVASCLLRWTRAPGWALLTAAVWAWHPTKAESVCWISGRTDLLVTIFILVVCRARAIRERAPRISWCIEIGATILAYASKETAILLPLFLCIESWSRQHQPVLNRQIVVSMLRSSTGQLLLATTYLAARSRWFPIVTWTHAAKDYQLPLTRIGLTLETLGRAAQLSFFPYRQAAEHGLAAFDTHNQLIISWNYAALGVLFVSAIVALVVLTRKRAPTIAVGSATLLITLLPTANLLPTHLQSVFYERFLYLPTIGLALLLTGLLSIVARHRSAERWLISVLACVLALASMKSTARAQDYADPERFWTHERAVNPLSTVAEQSLAELAQLRGDYAGALQKLSSCHRNANIRRQSRTAIRCVYDGALIVAESTPDLDRSSLDHSKHFFRAFTQPNSSVTAQLQAFGISLSIDLQSTAVNDIVHGMRGESLAILATVEQRLDDPEACSDAEAAIKTCPSCRYVLLAARVLAATDHVAEALRAIEPLRVNGPLQSVENVHEQIEQFAKWRQLSLNTHGPQSIHAEAQAYLEFGLFGAAYRVLAPHVREFSDIPDLMAQYARVAVLAGDETAARDALYLNMTHSDADKQLTAWSKQHLQTIRR